MNGWHYKTIGEVAEVIAGQSPDGSHYNGDGKGMPFYQGKKEFGEKFIGEPTTWTTDVTRVAREGDVLMSVRAPVGPVNFATREMCIGRGLAAIRSRNELVRDFLFYFLLHKRDEIEGTEGAVFACINKKQIEAIAIAVPPLTEQRRIVGILDQAFTGIATAKANAEKNLRNARELFESYLQSIFTKRGEGWEGKRLGDIAEFKNGLNFNQRSKGQSVRVVGVGDFGRNYLVPLANLQSVTIDDDLDESYQIREHDILTVRSNGSKDLVGRCMLVPAINEAISYSGFVIRIRTNTSAVTPRLLLHFMKCGATRARLTRDGGGANISNINQTKLSALTVSLPPLNKQRVIVETLDRLMQETERLESLYQQKLAALAALRKSLLHQAFTGQLVNRATTSDIVEVIR